MKRTHDIPTRLWNRDFLLVLISQLISIFGGGVIHFALPLHILHTTGDSALLGLVLGLAAIPLFLLTPVSGALADRFRKQRMMLWLDAFTTVIIVLYMLVTELFTLSALLVIVILLLMNAVQGIYAPAVDASVPVLVPAEKLVRANSAVMAVNTLSSLGSSAVAGILLGRFGVDVIIVIGAILFVITTVIDIFIRIPHNKRAAPTGIWRTVIRDLSQALRFVTTTKPAILKCAAALFLPTFAINGTIQVGLPVLITQRLDMSMEQMGISQSIMSGGILLGSIVTGVLGSRLTIQKVFWPTSVAGLFLLPIGLVFLFDTPKFAAYAMITATGAITVGAVQPILISTVAFVQTQTPVEVLGKVVSLITMVPTMASALGFLTFGWLYSRFAASPYVVIFIAAALVAAAVMLSRVLFRNLLSDIRNTQIDD